MLVVVPCVRACVRGEAKRRGGVGTVISGAGPGGAKISFSCSGCAPPGSQDAGSPLLNMKGRTFQILRPVAGGGQILRPVAGGPDPASRGRRSRSCAPWPEVEITRRDPGLDPDSASEKNVPDSRSDNGSPVRVRYMGPMRARCESNANPT